MLSVIKPCCRAVLAVQGMLNGRANVAVAMLERDFTVSGNILEREESGAMRLGAFELSHGTYGKLLSVMTREMSRSTARMETNWMPRPM